MLSVISGEKFGETIGIFNHPSLAKDSGSLCVRTPGVPSNGSPGGGRGDSWYSGNKNTDYLV